MYTSMVSKIKDIVMIIGSFSVGANEDTSLLLITAGLSKEDLGTLNHVDYKDYVRENDNNVVELLIVGDVDYGQLTDYQRLKLDSLRRTVNYVVNLGVAKPLSPVVKE